MNKLTEIVPQKVELMPEVKQHGVLYISENLQLAIHLCACGCGVDTVTPLSNEEWTFVEENRKVTLRPSIGNFSGEKPYHAHYFITKNAIQWL